MKTNDTTKTRVATKGSGVAHLIVKHAEGFHGGTYRDSTPMMTFAYYTECGRTMRGSKFMDLEHRTERVCQYCEAARARRISN